MLNDLSRREFLGTTSACSAVALFGLTEWHVPGLANAQEEAYAADRKDISPYFPQQEMEAVRAIVGAAHAQFDRVKELVSARPALAASHQFLISCSTHPGPSLMVYTEEPDAASSRITGDRDGGKSGGGLDAAALACAGRDPTVSTKNAPGT